MEYWRGYMDWSLDENWKCEICSNIALIWGFVHAQCRCDYCHTQYRMRDNDDKVVTKPICQLKPEYYEAFKILWEKDHRPVDEISIEEWDSVLTNTQNNP